MSTESDYVVKNAKLVFSHFSELVSRKCLISAHFGDRNTSFLTTIVNLDKNNNSLSLDCGPNDSIDQQLLASGKVLFRTEVEGIKVSFSGKGIKKTREDDEWVLSMPIPEAIFWMQRRQFYRVKIPLSHTESYCRLKLVTSNENEETVEQSVIFPLYDLSVSGMAFLNADAKWAAQLQPDCRFTECELHLHNGNHGNIGFVIKNNVETKTSATTTKNRIGCLFENVPTSFETNILRYMQEIEIQQKNVNH